ncbi:4-(cytidine 5'-diphospho)-2-C-methyl-D-erythritol kinase [Phreatobacter sp.]|uniref:4-(cytidine 5'-diphospho)-2-C-methyl-D-erythritol kinase n=1 Tax=Phreatobacter sp. TaxID=1966341 RepID=UPI003F6F479E
MRPVVSGGVLAERAPAKVNLTLAARRRRPDGYHDLESLVMFAATGDDLTFVPGGESFHLTVSGRTADAAGLPDDNLVLRAASHLAALVRGLPRGRFRLTKRLPVAAGLGGGSSDAAAALRLLARASGLAPDDPRLVEAARLTGADVPVCLACRSRMMRGTGAELGPVPGLPFLPAVLVNPGVAVSTPDVFRRLGLAPGEERPGDPAAAVETMDWPDRRSAQRAALVQLASTSRNDLEVPAQAIAPGVGEALALLSRTDGCRLARMSGSGATIFGLFDSGRAAAAAASAVRQVRPHWWIRPTVLA